MLELSNANKGRFLPLVNTMKAYLLRQGEDCIAHMPKGWNTWDKRAFLWRTMRTLISSNHRDMKWRGKGSKFKRRVWVEWEKRGGFGVHPQYSRPLLNNGEFSF